MSYITNQLIGNITVSGELLPSSNTWSLGSPTQTFSNLYVGADSIVISNPNPSVPPTDISVNSSNLLVVNRGGFAVKDESGLYDVFQLDPNGTLTVRSNVSTNPLTAAVVIIGNTTGDQNEPNNTGVMLHLTGLDESPARVYNDAYGSNAYSTFVGRRARGTAAVPLQTLSGDIVSRFAANPYSSNGFSSISTTRIDMVATETQTETTKGSNVQIWTTPIGSNVITKIATFDSAGIQLVGNVLVGKDLTVTGNSIAYGQTTSYANVVSYGNVISYGDSSTFGGLISTGNTQMRGDTQFSGNVVALKGIVFSDGSNVVTAGVSYINPGPGLAVTTATNYGVNLTTSAILGIAGTANQVYVNQSGGNVTLSLPQDLNTNSSPFFGNLTVGNLTVTGNITATQSTNLEVLNKVIYAGNGATTTAQINQGGFVLGNSEVAVSMLYSASPPGWNFNTDLYAVGNVYIGDGSRGDLHAHTAYISSNVEIGINPPVEFANANLQVTGTAPSTVQVTIQNILADPDASSDFVATADTGDDTVNYIDFGINSSIYNSPQYSAQKALDGYLYSSDSNLVISTAAVGKQIVFTTGGIQSANVAGLISNGRWVLGSVDDGVNTLQVSGTSAFVGNVSAGNISATGSVTAGTIVGQVIQASQLGITQVGILSNLSVLGGAGFADSLNIGGTAYIQNTITNASAFAQTLNVAGLAYTNQLISNLSVTTGTITATGTARVDRLIANTAIQSIGTITSQSIVNNTGIQSATLNITGAAQVDSMTTNLLTSTNTFNVVGLAIVNSLINNVRITTQTINSTGLATFNSLVSNTSTTTATLNATGAAQVSSLISNTNVFGASIQSSNGSLFNGLISNTNITTATLNTTGAAVVASLRSNSTVQAASGVIAGTFTSNTSVTSPAINATTTLWGQTVYSNTAITAATVITAQSIVSNSSIAAQTVNIAGAVQAGSINSNTSITAATLTTTQSIVSNSSIAGQTLNLSGLLQASSINSNSNIQASGNLVVGSINANVSVYATKFYGDGSNITGITLPYSNTNVANYLTGPVLVGNLTVGNTTPSTSTGTGAIVVNGGMGVAGNVYAQSINLSAGTATQAPILMTATTALANPAIPGSLNYDGYSFYGTPSDTQRGVITAAQYFQLGAIRALPLVAQPSTNSLFGQSVAVSGGTRYWYEIVASINKAGANGSVLQYSLGGGATLVEHDYAVISKLAASNVTIAASSMMNANLTANFSTMTTITSSPANGSQNFLIQIKGMIGVSVAGTITPQITLDSGTPTAYAVAPGSWMRIYPVGNTSTLGSNVAIGNWT